MNIDRDYDRQITWRYLLLKLPFSKWLQYYAWAEQDLVFRNLNQVGDFMFICLLNIWYHCMQDANAKVLDSKRKTPEPSNRDQLIEELKSAISEQEKTMKLQDEVSIYNSNKYLVCA